MAGSPKRVVGTLLFLIALVAVLAFYFVVFAGANQVGGVPGTDDLGIVAIGVAALLGIVAIILIILLASRKKRRAQEPQEEPYFLPPEEEAPAFEEVGDDLVVYDVWTLPVAQRAWGREDDATSAYYFPLNVEHGVYVNDYIGIDDRGNRLKLRTLLAGPADVGAASFVVPKREELPDDAWEEEAEWPADPVQATPARPERPRGQDFMQELERRFDEKGRAVVETGATYYDYKGDVHPVIEVEGIGTIYARKLNDHGIETTARLCFENPSAIAEAIDVPLKTVESWQAMAQLMKISGVGPQYAEALARAGIGGIEELKRRSAGRIADQVNEYLDSLDSNVLGQKITERRVAGWQAAAKAMRRVRQAEPEN